MSTLEPKWRCDECGEIHDTEDDAHECCSPEVTEGYLCPVCRTFHLEEDGALECCGYDPDGPLPPPSAEELEAAGQMRLFP